MNVKHECARVLETRGTPVMVAPVWAVMVLRATGAPVAATAIDNHVAIRHVGECAGDRRVLPRPLRSKNEDQRAVSSLGVGRNDGHCGNDLSLIPI